MNRRGRRETGSSTNISMIIFAIIIVIAIVAFIVSYMLYSRRLDARAKTINNTQKISSVTDNNMMNMIENTEEASSSIGKSVNEMENTEKIAVNTSNIEKKQTEMKKEEVNQIESKQTTNNEASIDDKQSKETETETETEKDPSFIKPVEGEKIKDYSKDNLIYSSTLDEWTTHLGIDFAAQKTDIVKAAADGKIKSIKNDPRYGLTVVIEHENGFESIYSSLLTAEFINVGEEVKQGQTIATVGNTARFEISDETHIHFEIKKDGVNVDPNIYIKE